jgi:hypothetical protein
MSVDVIARQLGIVSATILFVGALVYMALDKIAAALKDVVSALGIITAVLEGIDEDTQP